MHCLSCSPTGRGHLRWPRTAGRWEEDRSPHSTRRALTFSWEVTHWGKHQSQETCKDVKDFFFLLPSSSLFPNSLVSETSGCYTARQPVDPVASGPTESTVVTERSRSNVFRPGDYNAPSVTAREQFLSVQQKDFGPRKLLPAGVSTATRKGYSHVFPR